MDSLANITHRRMKRPRGGEGRGQEQGGGGERAVASFVRFKMGYEYVSVPPAQTCLTIG